uniref:Uncharacterized protein n=1 Tax=Anopheles merus TaxID=30066 RepID=A0A182VNZ5_ANOME
MYCILQQYNIKRHIRGDQDALAPVTECAEHVVALLLRFVAVDGHRPPPIAVDDARNVVDTPLRLDEDDRLRVRLGRNLLFAHIHDLQNVVVGGQVQRPDVDLYVVGQKLLRQIAHLLRPGRRPHQHLPVRADLAHNFADLRLEAHVQHAVGLVQHQVGAAPQVRDAALEKINQPPGGGNHDLGTPLEVPDLRALRGAAKNARIVGADARTKVRRDLLNLLRQLAGGRENQRNRAVAASYRRLVLDVHQRRHHVGQRLARPGLCNTHHVATAQRNRHALGLDGRRFGEALALQLLHDVHGQPAVLKLHAGARHVAALQSDLMLVEVAVNVGHAQAHQAGRRLVKVLLERRQILRLPLHVAEVLAILRLAVERPPVASTVTASSTLATETTAHRTSWTTATVHSTASETITRLWAISYAQKTFGPQYLVFTNGSAKCNSTSRYHFEFRIVFQYQIKHRNGTDFSCICQRCATVNIYHIYQAAIVV